MPTACEPLTGALILLPIGAKGRSPTPPLSLFATEDAAVVVVAAAFEDQVELRLAAPPLGVPPRAAISALALTPAAAEAVGDMSAADSAADGESSSPEPPGLRHIIDGGLSVKRAWGKADLPPAACGPPPAPPRAAPADGVLGSLAWPRPQAAGARFPDG